MAVAAVEKGFLGATPEQWALIAALPLNQAVNNAMFTVVGPFRGDFALSYVGLGIVLASYGVARFAMDVPAGVLIRRVPLRLALIVALVANLGASVGPLAATAVWQVAIARAIQGLSSSVAQAAILAWLIIGAHPATRGRVMALSEVLFSVVGLIVPVATGAMAALWGWHAAYVSGSAAAGAACLAVILGTRAVNAPPTTGGDAAGEAAGSIRSAALAGGGTLLAAYLLAFIAAFSRFGMLNTLLPVIGSDQLGLSPVQVGLGLTLSNLSAIVVLMIGGWAGDRFGRRRLAAPGVVVLLACQFALFLAANGTLYFFVVTAQGLAYFMNSFPTSLVGDSLPPHLRSIGVAGYRLVVDAAVLLAPIIVGAASDWGGFDAAKILTIGLTAAVRRGVVATTRRTPAVQMATHAASG
jgi:MFS family permease